MDRLLDTKQLLWIIGVLMAVVGLLVGHITTRQAMAEQTQKILDTVKMEYVPRTEVELQLERINEKLDEALKLLKENG